MRGIFGVYVVTLAELCKGILCIHENMPDRRSDVCMDVQTNRWMMNTKYFHVSPPSGSDGGQKDGTCFYRTVVTTNLIELWIQCAALRMCLELWLLVLVWLQVDLDKGIRVAIAVHSSEGSTPQDSYNKLPPSSCCTWGRAGYGHVRVLSDHHLSQSASVREDSCSATILS